MEALDRRVMLTLLGAASAASVLPLSALPAAPPRFAMWRDPGCGCCLEWARRIETAFARRLAVVDTRAMADVKRAHGVPPHLQSCHTALIMDYVIEGHVPPQDIKRLVASRNRAIRGLAVPGMPAGAPGMDVGHGVRQPYRIFAFTARGATSVFASHNQAR